MKTLITALTYSMLLLLSSSCDKENDTTASKQKGITGKLRAGAWTPAEVRRDGGNITAAYTSMRLTIDTNTYSTTNGGLAWPLNGTWTFPEGSTTTILRDNAVLITFALSSDSKTLDMDFVIAERQYTGGKVTGLEGVYHFKFTRP